MANAEERRVTEPGVLFCAGFAFAAAVQPGPLQAFLFSRAAADGWKRTLPASIGPLLSDVLPALLALFAFGRLPAAAQPLLRTAGGLLLLYLAWTAARRLQPAVAPLAANPGSAPATLLQAALVNVLNPNPYLGWALVLGPAVAAAWRRHPGNAVAMLVAFYGTMVATLAALICVFGTARLLSVRAQRALLAASALILAALAVFQLGVGLAGLLR
jgi:threonine/homoserine/homoserine lactone efflux protein